MHISPRFLLRKPRVATEGHPHNAAGIALLLLGLYFFSPIQLVKAQDPRQETKPTGATIRGQVVYADTGRPLRHANLELLSIENNASNRNAATDKRGEFVFEDVPSGHFVIVIDSLNVLRPIVGRSQSSWTNLLRLGEREFLTEVVVSGTENRELKIKAERGGVITGRVLDQNDEPVVDAEIRLLKRENESWVPVAFTWSPSNRDIARTDSTGSYRVTGLRSGDYLVRVSEASLSSDNETSDSELYGEGSLLVAYYPNTVKVRDAQTVSVIQGRETTGVDVRLPEPPLHTVSGTIIYGSEGRFGGITIQRKDEVGISEELLYVTVKSDKDGNWRVGIPDGEYVLTVNTIYAERGNMFSSAPARINLKVAGSDIRGLKISVMRGATVSGKVTVDGKSVSNLNNLSAALLPIYEPTTNSVTAQADSELISRHRDYYVTHSGDFSMRSLASGKYWFQLVLHEQNKYYVKAVSRKGVNLVTTPIQLTEGMRFDDVEVVLSTNLARIEGAVTANPNKKSFRGVVVVLAPANELTRRFSSGITTALPDDQGRFAFDCAPGEYFVTALNSGQIEKGSTPLNASYFKDKDPRLVRITVGAGEKSKALTVSILDK